MAASFDGTYAPFNDSYTFFQLASRMGDDATAYATFLDRLLALKGDDQAFFKAHQNFYNRLTVVQSIIREHGLKATCILLVDCFSRSSNGTL